MQDFVRKEKCGGRSDAICLNMLLKTVEEYAGFGEKREMRRT